MTVSGAERRRLEEDARRARNWKRWGPYLSERQWGTVREDYSRDGESWDYFTHDQARSRAYRWGEDGLLGICDRECRLCFALALWNGRDPILKERLFGLTGREGNHGEDVKECYYYLDSTPTHSYMRALYKYPQAEYPYETLVRENRRRGRDQAELELLDTGVFDGDRYFDVFAEYAKASPDDLLVRITVANRGPEAAALHLLPTLWFRNTWSPERTGDGYARRPSIERAGESEVVAEHETLGRFRLAAAPGPDDRLPELLFTDNESNAARLFGVTGGALYTKDAFHEHVIGGRAGAVNPAGRGTRVAAYYRIEVPAGGEVAVQLRLYPDGRHDGERDGSPRFGRGFDAVFAERRRDADEFYAALIPDGATAEERRVMRQGYAGLLWSKQFYHYVVRDWLEGDPAYPTPPSSRLRGRNADWRHLYNRDVISMPDKWEYPWYAAWDLAFHMIPFASLDPQFTKEQLVLFLREWYMHPSGQIPAYEFALGDVNPPVHAWACWRAYKVSAAPGQRDRAFLERVFHKLMLNFTWWVNRKDLEGKHLFAGGFLGLDNIGLFDRSQPLPGGGNLEQADGTAWMAFYSATMLGIALELARDNPAYEDVASKFFEHFVAIADAMNRLGGSGLWHEQDGFYYDHLHTGDVQHPLRIRSLVGIVPLFACELIDDEVMERLPGFARRVNWFYDNRPELAGEICSLHAVGGRRFERRLLAIPSRERLVRVLRYALDEGEFLSPYGLRALSRVHREHPYVLRIDGVEHRVDYLPAESDSGLFGGNSNWRGPVWFPLNYLLIEALERYHDFYGDSLRVECPTGSGRLINLAQVAHEIGRRLGSLFLPDASGRRPSHGDERRYAEDPHWRDLILFSEYFDGDTGRGAGASHQTGWTALAIRCLEDAIRDRAP